MLGKTLLNLDAGRPRRSIPSSIRTPRSASNAAELLPRRDAPEARRPATSRGAARGQGVRREASRAASNRILDAAREQRSSRLKVDAIDETVLIEGLQKIANRIALGLVLAALIVGAALLMQVPTNFRIFGYPASRCSSSSPRRRGRHRPRLSIVFGDVKRRKRRHDQ